MEIHLTDLAERSFRGSNAVSSDDVHFAIRVTDSENLVTWLSKLGYLKDLPDDDGKCVIIKRNRLAGDRQLYGMDVDRHLVEINVIL
jgi:hypothetical protein